ncbi:tetratricopeptide repeat protein [Saccharothrix sp.]|uniref:tetratricopeptide repeat protein n=1 Tax=Saccharothrix sp. TaxID=1873460 RepID=UPI00281172DE|nr:tetratricopeptide repeat protein [Saccharothrix sp.]
MSGSDSEGYRRAFELFRQGRYADAETVLAPLARAHADDPDVVQALANCHAQLGRYEEAIAGLRRVIALDPTRLADARKLGVILEQVGDYTEAARVYRSILEVEDYGDVAARLHGIESAAAPTTPAGPTPNGDLATPALAPNRDVVARDPGPVAATPPPETVALRTADGVLVPGAAPIQRVVGRFNTTDRGKPHLATHQVIRYRVLTASGAVARAVLVSLVPLAVDALRGELDEKIRADTAVAFDFLAVALPYVILAMWLWAAIKVVRSVLYAMRYQVVVFERGIDVAEGLLRRSRRFVWYYQLTEEPAYERTALMALMNVASLSFIYNDASSTTKHVVLEAIGTEETVEALRRYIEERRLVERISIRGIVS